MLRDGEESNLLEGGEMMFTIKILLFRDGNLKPKTIQVYSENFYEIKFLLEAELKKINKKPLKYQSKEEKISRRTIKRALKMFR